MSESMVRGLCEERLMRRQVPLREVDSNFTCVRLRGGEGGLERTSVVFNAAGWLEQKKTRSRSSEPPGNWGREPPSPGLVSRPEPRPGRRWSPAWRHAASYTPPRPAG